MENKQDGKKAKNKTWKVILLLAVVVAFIITAIVWWRDNNRYIKTTDANLETYRIAVAPLVSGTLLRVYVEEGQKVSAGDLLALVQDMESPKYDSVFSPVNGVIAKRWKMPGDVVSMGQNLMTINQPHPLWVQLYLEETKYWDVRMNSKVTFSLDAYKGLTFYGHVFYIGSNTASQFSIIPAGNASGNYTKVTQRVPIKISVDSVSGGYSLQELNLVSGMSADVKMLK